MWRRVPLLLVVYVTLDFANPLMPGAVRFERGSIEIVPGNRAAGAESAVPIPPAILQTVGAAVNESPRPLRRPPAPRGAAPAVRVVRRPPLERSVASPSPTDDH